MDTTLEMLLDPLQKTLARNHDSLVAVLGKLAPLAAVAGSKDESPDLPLWKQNADIWLKQREQVPAVTEAFHFTGDGTFETVDLEQFGFGRGGLLKPIEEPLNSIDGMLGRQFRGTVPVGSILIGGSLGLILGELADQWFTPNTSGFAWQNQLTKLGMIAGLVFIGKMLLSTTGVVAGVTVLGVQMIADILPLDKITDWILNLFNKTPKPRVAHSAQQWPVMRTAQVNGHQRVGNYYAGLRQAAPVGVPQHDALAGVL